MTAIDVCWHQCDQTISLLSDIADFTLTNDTLSFLQVIYYWMFSERACVIF